MPWYDLGSAFILHSLPLGGGPSHSTYSFTPSDPIVAGIAGPILTLVDEIDLNGDTYPDFGGNFVGGTVTPIDPGSIMRVGSVNYTVVNVWHSTANLTLLSGPTGSGIHYFEITDGTTTLFVAFPNRGAALVDPAEIVEVEGNGIVDWITLGHSASTWFNSILPNYLPGTQGTPTSPPCFAAGTRIAVPGGWRRVEELGPGDLVETLDHGAVPLCWTGGAWGGPARLSSAGEAWRPWRVAAGALGPGRPERDLVLSAQHRLLIEGPAVAAETGHPAVLVAVRHLGALPGIAQERGRREIEYVHLMPARHAVLIAEGALAESLWPGPVALAGLRGPGMAGPPEALCAELIAAGPARPLIEGRLARRLARRLADRGGRPARRAA